MKSPSIRGRVVAFVLLAQIVAIGGAVGLVTLYVRGALLRAFDSELRGRTASVLALVQEADEEQNGLTFDGAAGIPPAGDLFAIRDMHGNQIAGSTSGIRPADFNLPKDEIWDFKQNGKGYRAAFRKRTPILDQEAASGGNLIRVDVFYAMPTATVEAQIWQAARVATYVSVLALLLGLSATWLAVTRGLQPLTEFAHQADLIQSRDLHFDGKGNGQVRELRPITLALTSLMARLRVAFDRERRFVSDAAHELKTAIAIQKSTLQLLEREIVGPEKEHQGVARALEDTARTERLVANMLLLAAAEHSSDIQREAPPLTRLDSSLHAAIAELTPMSELKAISVLVRGPEKAYVRGEASEVQTLWMNLIENAIQHSPNGSVIVVEIVVVRAAEIAVRIVDRGAGITAEALPHVFQRFYRADVSRSRLTGGFGLGLAIAKAVTEKCGGSIGIESEPGKGTTVSVRLPLVM